MTSIIAYAGMITFLTIVILILLGVIIFVFFCIKEFLMMFWNSF